MRYSVTKRIANIRTPGLILQKKQLMNHKTLGARRNLFERLTEKSLRGQIFSKDWQKNSARAKSSRKIGRKTPRGRNLLERSAEKLRAGEIFSKDRQKKSARAKSFRKIGRKTPRGRNLLERLTEKKLGKKYFSFRKKTWAGYA